MIIMDDMIILIGIEIVVMQEDDLIEINQNEIENRLQLKIKIIKK